MKSKILLLFFLVLVISCNNVGEGKDKIQEIIPEIINETRTIYNETHNETNAELNSAVEEKIKQNVQENNVEVSDEEVKAETIFTTDSCRKANGWPTDVGRGKECKDDEYDAGKMVGYISEHVCCVKI